MAVATSAAAIALIPIGILVFKIICHGEMSSDLYSAFSD